MSRSILVVNSGSFVDADYSDPIEVPFGAFAAFDDEGNLIQVADGADGDTVQGLLRDQPCVLVIGGGSGNIPVRMTNMLYPERVVSVEKKSYTAPAKQVTDVTPVTGKAGIASIKIEDVTTGYPPFPKTTSEVKIGEGDTATQIAQALVDQLNTVQRSPVVASVSGGKVRLTAKQFGTSFVTSVQETQEKAVRTSVTAPSLGSGTGQQIRDMEWRNRAFMTGDYYVQDGILGDREGLAGSASINGLANTGANYDVYAIRYLNDQEDSINRAFHYHEIMVCVATTGVTGNADVFFGV